jgi:phosphoribosyl-AMP cyclohydrolase
VADNSSPFCDPSAAGDVEEGSAFAPKFNADGLLPAVACDATTGEVLMLAYMNHEALQASIETGIAHYWSRSRNKLWRKGETSGEQQHIEAILTDCDQDAIVLKVQVAGRGATCHTGRVTCFYRTVKGLGGKAADATLQTTSPERLFDPAEVYGKPGSQ